MRNKVIAGNWKMNKDKASIALFMENINKNFKKVDGIELIVNIPSLYVDYTVGLNQSDLKLGVQNIHFAKAGAYTAEISTEMLNDFDVDYIVIGHSERRQYFNETDETVNLKLKKILSSKFIPIVCCGEPLEVREAGTTNDLMDIQITKAYYDITAEQALKTIVAYEPIWAIGTGVVATKEQANDTCKYIRSIFEKIYSIDVAEKMIIQYGGSVSESNALELLTQSDIDGALIGGASLEADSLLAIYNALK